MVFVFVPFQWFFLEMVLKLSLSLSLSLFFLLLCINLTYSMTVDVSVSLSRQSRPSPTHTLSLLFLYARGRGLARSLVNHPAQALPGVSLSCTLSQHNRSHTTWRLSLFYTLSQHIHRSPTLLDFDQILIPHCLLVENGARGIDRIYL